MLTLVDRAFRHLGGSGAGSSVFLLSQVMGGGKTHSMIALGLLARDPALRSKVLTGAQNPAPKLGTCRVAGFNGRSTDAAGGIWGSIAEQLGKAEQFARYVSPLLSAPGPEAWKQLLGGEPLVLFLDELPPYLEYAVAVPVGNADLGVVTTAALANLFVAVADMNNVCLVLSDLAGSNFSIGQSKLQDAFNRAVQGITSESRRIAVPITPVNPNGDELYHILRKRLFAQVAPEADIKKVADADLAFAGNQSGEATLRHTLEGEQKFTVKIVEDSFRTRAEARLFGSADTKVVLWSDFKRAAAVNTNWPLHKLSALDDLKADCLRRGLWREEGNHIRRGPFPPPVPEVMVRELSVQEDGDGSTYLKIEPLHAPVVVFETGDAEPTRASSPVPTPTRFEATALRYRFLAFDPADMVRDSVVKEWTAKLRLKYQLHHRGDHHEVELLALPKANSIAIRYTTDGSSPTSVGTATYDGPFRVPAHCRVVCAIAVSSEYGICSETIRIAIPQKGGAERPPIDLATPARWTQQTKLDDASAVWDTIVRLEQAGAVTAHDISLTAESTDGQQNVEYSGALDSGYNAMAVKAIAQKLQDIVSGDTPPMTLRMTIGSLAFFTGQALLDWIKSTNQPINTAKVSQAASAPASQAAGQ